MTSQDARRNRIRFAPMLEELEERRLMTFKPAAVYAANPSSHHIVAGEFRTGSGLTDLAVANWSEDKVTVLPSKPNGTFGEPRAYHVGDNPTGIATGDLDCDGNLDLAVTNYGVDTVSLLFGTGGRRFYPTAHNFYAGNNAFEVAIADFTNDGMPDILTGHYTTSLGTETLRLLKGHCNSLDFDDASPINTNYTEVYDLEVSDFNEDGALDVAVTHHHLGGPVGVLLGNGNGTFKPPLEYTVEDYPEGIASGDMNQDGKQDLLVAFTISDEVGILLGNGDGTFQAPIRLQMPGSLPAEVVVADFGDFDSGAGNPDGREDFAIALRGSSEVAVCYNMFPHFSCMPHAVGDGEPYYDLVAANFNVSEDTILPDLATPNHSSPTVSVLINTSMGRTPPTDGSTFDIAYIAALCGIPNVGSEVAVSENQVSRRLDFEPVIPSARAQPRARFSDIVLSHWRFASASNDLLIMQSSLLGDLLMVSGL